jgi:murein L,D-transpeptidase YafK
MWIKLNNKEIDTYGSVGYGSSFKICLEYPLPIDAQRTRKFSPGHNPGSAICIHGNCVTAGCISFENKDFLPVFLSACFHDSKLYGLPKVHIFPFRFSDALIDSYSEQKISIMDKQALIGFWNEIRKAYDQFNVNKKALKISYQNNTYVFTEY